MVLPDLKLMKIEEVKQARELVIAFDIDGVLANIHLEWLRRYNRDYKDNLQVEDIKNWDMTQFVVSDCGKDIYKYLTPNLYQNTPVFEGAVDCVTWARIRGRVIFVTTPTPETLGVKYQWLKDNHFSPSIKDYVECGDKGLIKADILIDDYDKNFLDFTGKKLLFDSPWNRGVTIGGLIRVKGYKEVLKNI